MKINNLAMPLRYLKLVLYAGANGTKYKENQVLSNLNILNKVSFDINNTVSGAMQEANVTISGLKLETMSFLSTSFSPWVQAPVQNKLEIYAGYTNSNALIFSGTIIEAIPNFNNAEYNISLKCITAFPVLLNDIKNYSFEGQQDLITILEQINNDLGFTFINSLENSYIVNNYTYKETSIINHIRNLAKLTNINIYIENEHLIAIEQARPNKTYKKIKLGINDIIASIQPNSLGMELDIKMNSALRSGQEVEVQSLRFPQLNKNSYVIQTIGHNGDTRGDNWKTHLVLLRKDIYGNK